MGGAWGARLGALEALQPIFLLLMVGAFGLAFRRVYRVPEACAPGQACAVPAVRRRQRIGFWLAAAVATLLVALPLYAPWFC